MQATLARKPWNWGFFLAFRWTRPGLAPSISTAASPERKAGSHCGWRDRETHVVEAGTPPGSVVTRAAVDHGDTIFAPGFKALLKDACAVGRRRPHLADATIAAHRRRLE